MDYFYGWKPYVRVGARRAQAAREAARLQKKGRTLDPVWIEGRKIATTFWGAAWCDNLERYSDFANRLPRGRTYVRNGSVIDLQIARGAVTALVSGSDMYTVRIGVAAVPGARWKGICRDCTGAIDSLVELLQGKLSTGVITRICEPKTGLFPDPRELSFQCSCPDWASMCKHVAAVLYGVGARFDERPELLFLLRGVEQEDLIAKAGTGLRVPEAGTSGKVIESGDLSQIFDIEIAAADASAPAVASRRAKAPRAAAAPHSTPAKAPAAEKAHTPVRRLAKKAPKKGSAAWRQSVSERMKKYWAARRRAVAVTPATAGERKAAAAGAGAATPAAGRAKTATKAARPTRQPRPAPEDAFERGSAAWRQAVSEEMKRYWAAPRPRAAKRRR